MFSTKIDIQPSDSKIAYSSKIMLLGSCFSENIGKKLTDLRFDVDVNPFGVLFNPASISENIGLLLNKKAFNKNDLFLHNSLWASYMHSTQFSDPDLEKCLNKINSRLSEAADRISTINYLVLTFGTAWMYKLAENKKVVANCHKLPSDNFVRQRLSADEIVLAYAKLIEQLKAINPGIELIFTVSPVRHWKDGPTENAISKGILLQATQEITRLHKNTHYFPAYEIVMDELRDYRFYAPDMLHPSEVAVDYIFKRFSDVYFEAETIQCMNDVKSYKSGLSHRPIHTETTEFEKFAQHLATKRQDLLNKYPILKNRI